MCDLQILQLRRPGRPRGAKDNKPRITKNVRQNLADASGEQPLIQALNTSDTTTHDDTFQSEICLCQDHLEDVGCQLGSPRIQRASEMTAVNHTIRHLDPFHDDWLYW